MARWTMLGVLVGLGAACGGERPQQATTSSVAGASASTAAGAATTAAPAPTTGSAAFPSNGKTVQVYALDNTFRAENTTIVAGTTVKFVNRGKNDHNVSPVRGGGFGVDVPGFKPGMSYSFEFDVPGTYPYVCTIHGVNGKGMVGTITVTAPGT